MALPDPLTCAHFAVPDHGQRHIRAHWEQAFSPDGGKTWEVNWVMTFTRVGAT